MQVDVIPRATIPAADDFISRISTVLSLNLSIKDFLENPTVAQMAEFI
jgi:hypothetical protein